MADILTIEYRIEYSFLSGYFAFCNFSFKEKIKKQLNFILALGEI